jgi:CBS domain-containing protein
MPDLPKGDETMNTLKEIVETTGRGVFATSPLAMIVEAVEVMCREHVRALLVGDVGNPLGIVSERDILERVILPNRDPLTTPVELAMTSPLVSLPADATASEALAFMRTHRLHQVPIVSDEAVVGVVSSTDLMRWATREQEYEILALKEYCCGKYPG